MSDFEFDLFNIETMLIEANSMDSLETPLLETADLFSLSEDVVDMFRVLLYKQ